MSDASAVTHIIDRVIPDWRETVAKETEVRPSIEWERIRDDFIAKHPDALDPPDTRS